MPIFIVRCNDCSNEWEFFDRSIANPTQPVCPGRDGYPCNSTNTEKLIGSPSVHYKGNGFYSTDHKSEKNQQDRISYLGTPD